MLQNPGYARLRRIIPEVEWLLFEPLIEEIQQLKRTRNALLLAHNYQTVEIFHGVADLHGDSLALARHAVRSDAAVLVMCGVRFMAETAKLLCPDKTVLLPDAAAGCSLAASITPEDVRVLRRAHPAAPVVCYVNTSAAVKAGLAASTIDGTEIVTISGTQTLSRGCCVLLTELGTLREIGVTHFRLSPQKVDMVLVAGLYRDVLDGKKSAAEALQALRSVTGDIPYVNGFLHGREGLAWSEACVAPIA